MATMATTSSKAQTAPARPPRLELIAGFYNLTVDQNTQLTIHPTASDLAFVT
ncbi:MAG TPA: hypothetical protein PLD46_04795 [Hyphomicrobium sp.]|nr:hypothetical protein [Hyphomicrobium sp.]